MAIGEEAGGVVQARSVALVLSQISRVPNFFQ